MSRLRIGIFGTSWWADSMYLPAVTAIGAMTATLHDRPNRPDGGQYEWTGDSAVMNVRFANGAHGTLQTSTVCWEGTAFNQTHHLDAHGSDGTLYSLNDWDAIQEARGLKAVAVAASRRFGVAASSRLTLGIVLSSVMLLTAACSRAAPTPVAGPGAEFSAVGIEAIGCGLRPAIGSGAVVAEPGLVVTVAHTVAGSDQITVIDHAGIRHDAVLQLLDPASDIAVLRVDALQAEPLSLGSANPPADGHLLVRGRRDEIASVPVTMTRRIVVTIEGIYIENDVERTAFELSGSVESGDSGGVVVVDEAAVAMVYARARNTEGVGFAVDEKELGQAVEAARNGRPGPIDSGPCVP